MPRSWYQRYISLQNTLITTGPTMKIAGARVLIKPDLLKMTCSIIQALPHDLCICSLMWIMLLECKVHLEVVNETIHKSGSSCCLLNWAYIFRIFQHCSVLIYSINPNFWFAELSKKRNSIVSSQLFHAPRENVLT